MTNYEHFKHWAVGLPCDERLARAWARGYVAARVNAGGKSTIRYHDPMHVKKRESMRKLREKRSRGEA